MFFNFSNDADRINCGAVVDIGSGSVGVAIVVSDGREKQPKIIWSHRERVVISSVVDQSTDKLITTALFKAILELGNGGVRNLRHYDKKLSIQKVCVSISSPWSYTVTSTIDLNKDRAFTVTPKLVEELVKKAKKQSSEKVDRNLVAKKLDLVPVEDSTISITENGYLIKNPYSKTVKNISLTRLAGFAGTHLVESIQDSIDKILPEVDLEITTFMFTYYRALKKLNTKITDACLVDITAEATEIGIVRNQILEHTTHNSFGSYTLARKISAAASIPFEEALGYLRDNAIITELSLSEAKQAAVVSVITEYETSLLEVFRRSGDKLSTPRNIFLHADATTEAFFKKIIENTSQKSTGNTHNVYPVTSKYFENSDSEDTAILLSAYVFHKNLFGGDYIEK